MSDYVHFKITFLEPAGSRDDGSSENLGGNCQLAFFSIEHILLHLAITMAKTEIIYLSYVKVIAPEVPTFFGYRKVASSSTVQ